MKVVVSFSPRKWTRLAGFLVVLLVFCNLWLNYQPMIVDDMTFNPTGEKIRTFRGKHLQWNSSPPPSESSTSIDFPRFTPDCDQWVVMLGKHASKTESLSLVKNWTSWCIIIVDDGSANQEFEKANTDENQSLFFLSMAQQKSIKHPLVQRTLSSLRADATRSIRKNIGYLFAIRHGAKAIFDFEIPNPQSNLAQHWLPLGVSSPAARLRVRSAQDRPPRDYNTLPLFNPIPYMVPQKPNADKQYFLRGFPHNATLGGDGSMDTPYHYGSVEYSSVGVVHSVLCEDVFHDEDECAIHTNPQNSSRLLIPADHFTPYNSKSTTYLQQAFWGLLLPLSVPDEFADIVRAYMTQALLHELNFFLIFEPPTLGTIETNHLSKTSTTEVQAWEWKLQSLLQFLSSDFKSSQNTTKSWSLPSRVEQLMVDLYERGFIGVEDVYTSQEWLLGLRDVGYDFPAKGSESSKLQVEPSLHDQPYFASPAFNVDKDGARYMDYIKESHKPGSLDLFNEWLSRKEERKVGDGILKLVTMSKDEWPILQDWVWYHGELLGFENLYILDGSTDSRSIAFLVHARDYLGANVIFSSSDLNHLQDELSEVAREISKASDFVMKFDVDEYLVAQKGEPTCEHATGQDVSEVYKKTDCSLSPYAVLKTVEALRQVSTGDRVKIGYLMSSEPNLIVCNSDGTKDDIAAFPLSEVSKPDWFKTLSDSRTFVGVDLGGHNNFFAEPFGRKGKGPPIDLGVLHFHSRCLATEVANCRKAMVSHNFIDEDDTEEVSRQKLLQRNKLKSDEVDICSLPRLHGQSNHKTLFYLKYVSGCIDDSNFYGRDMFGKEIQLAGVNNPDFRKFLNDARARHDLSPHV